MSIAVRKGYNKGKADKITFAGIQYKRESWKINLLYISIKYDSTDFKTLFCERYPPPFSGPPNILYVYLD